MIASFFSADGPGMDLLPFTRTPAAVASEAWIQAREEVI